MTVSIFRVNPTFADTPTFRFFITPLNGFKQSYFLIEYLYSLHNWGALIFIQNDHLKKAEKKQIIFSKKLTLKG